MRRARIFLIFAALGGLFGAPGFADPATRPKGQFYPEEAEIRLKPGVAYFDFLAKLNQATQGLRVTTYRGEPRTGLTIRVRGARALSESELVSLEKISVVQTVTQGVYGLPSPSCPNCNQPRPTEPIVLPQKPALESIANELPAATSCKLDERCPNSGKQKLWAQRAVDADLMNEEIQARGLRAGDAITRVAVIDSGFDEAHRASMSRSVRALAATDRTDPQSGKALIGPPANDQNGHGTMVAGIIGGKNGIGVAPRADISVYRVTANGDAGSTSSDLLIEGMRRACDQNADPRGLTLINLSWGGREDEMGLHRNESERDYKKLFRELADRGCVVVKSAGNDSFRLEDDAVNGRLLDDVYLRVAATDTTRLLASFSSTGELQAPGAGVYTLESSTAFHSMFSDRCDASRSTFVGQPSRRFVSGTSFAAPITAGVASEVLGVLKGPGFSKLKPRDRIALLNRVLSASMRGGTISGLRAVLIAERWKKRTPTESGQLPTVESLNNLLKTDPPAFCRESVAYKKSNECGPIQQQENLARKQVAACEAASGSAVSALLAIGLDHDQLETALDALYYLKSRSSTPDELKRVESAAETLTDRFLSRWTSRPPGATGELTELQRSEIRRRLEVNIASQLYPGLLARAAEKPNAENKARVRLAMQALLESHSLADYLARDPKIRGSEEKLEFAVTALKSAREILGDAEITRVLNDNVDLEIKSQLSDIPTASEGTHLTTSVRVLDALGQAPEFSDSRKELRAIETKIWNSLDRANHLYSEVPDDLGFLGEKFRTATYFEPLLSRHTADIRGAIARGEVSALGPIKVAHVLNHLEEFFPDANARAEFLLKLTEEIHAGRGWGKWNDPIFFAKALSLLTAITQGDRARTSAIQARLTTQVQSSNSFGMLTRLMNDTLPEAKGSLALTSARDSAVRRLALAIVDYPGDVGQWTSSRPIPMIGRIVNLLGEQKSRRNPIVSAIPLAIPVPVTRPYSRLDRPPPPVTTTTLPPAPDLAERLLLWAIGQYRNRSEDYGSGKQTRANGAVAIEEVIDAYYAHRLLKDRGDWKVAARALLREAESQPGGDHDSRVLDKLRAFLSRFENERSR